MIVGEAPGEQEDRTGMPFAPGGRSGKLLRATLAENGFPDGTYYLTNIVKCRPPENRNPTPDEIEACSGWFLEELQHVRPKTILALGKFAQASLHEAQTAGIVPAEIPIVDLYHPAYILRSPRHRPAWKQAILEVAGDLGISPVSSGVLATDTPGSEVTVATRVPPTFPYVQGTPDWHDPYYAADTETDDLEEGYGVRTVGYSVSDGFSGAFRGGTYAGGAGDYADLQPLAGRVRDGLRTWLHNAKYDAPALGIDLRNFDAWEDTMLIAYVLRYPRVGLKLLSDQVAGFPLSPISDIIGTGKKRIPFSEALRRDPDRASTYALEDAVGTSRIARSLDARLSATPRLDTYYRTVEKPAVAIIGEMEQRGVLVDPDVITTLATELRTQIDILEGDQYVKLAWPGDGPGKKKGQFNRRSTQQLAQELIRQGVVLTETTPTGKWKLDDDILERLGNVHPAIPVEREIRKLEKLEGTYTGPLLSARDSAGRIHARFNQAVTNTSRLSSSDPNLQNIPIRTPLGKRIREAFIARLGHRILKADASQLEVRVYADYTLEPVLVDAYTHIEHDTAGRRGSCLRCDVHQQVAFQLDISRDDAKNTLFAAIYGAEEEKLARTAHVPVEDTGPFLARMRNRVPSLLTYKKWVAGELLRQGYVETLLGFRSYFPLFASPIRSEKAEALRQAGNLPIQGTGAGIIKVAMTEADALARRYEAHFVLTVHDEVVYEVPEANVIPFARDLRILFRDVAARWMKHVPFRLDCAVGDSWGTVKEIPGELLDAA